MRVHLLKPEEAAAALTISRRKVYELFKSGELRSVKVGRLRRVPLPAIDEYIERLAAAQSDDTTETE